MTSIILEDVTLDYPVFAGSKSLRTELIVNSVGGRIRRHNGSRKIHVRALDGVSLCVEERDRVALLGPNGAGKTTMLRVMAGIYEPSQGTAQIKGRVSALFNTSLGMDPDDTGYENIVHIGMFLGMAAKEVRRKSEKIAEFAGLRDFIDLPVRTYSAGMQTRLAFAIATAIDPGIILLDEGIVAGDASFVEKANRRLDELIDRSSSLVIASHSEDLVETMCNKAVLMEHGRIVRTGPVGEVLAEYRERRQHY